MRLLAFCCSDYFGDRPGLASNLNPPNLGLPSILQHFNHCSYRFMSSRTSFNFGEVQFISFGAGDVTQCSSSCLVHMKT
jgi:hypothetical protein